MRRVLGPVLGLVLVLGAAPAALAGTGAVQISSDPYTNSDSQHQTQVEPGTFAFGSTVVAAFQSGRYFDGGASNVSFATSTDGGTTWTTGSLPGTTVFSAPAGPYARATDPSVAYDAKHDVWMITSLALDASVTGAAVLTSRSTDGGLTWGAPVVVSAASGNSDYDKTWTACDNSPTSPYYGNCYSTWDDFGKGDLLLMSVSSDGGLTWDPAQMPQGSPSGLGGIPIAQPSGVVIVPASDAFGLKVIAFRSTNGGASWGSALTVARVTAHRVAGNLRVSASLPSAGVDATGKVYTVWADCRFRKKCASNDLVMSTSTDGLTWARARRIPIDPTTSAVDHFLPGLAVDRGTSGSSARLSLTYYYYPNATCTAATCQLFVGFVSSADGGATWSTPRTLGGPISLSWLADTSQGRMVGDYISTSIVEGGSAVGVFALADAPAGGLFDEAMFATVVTPTSFGATAERTSATSLNVTVEEPVQSTRSDGPPVQEPLAIR